jgi:hypothetical protein
VPADLDSQHLDNGRRSLSADGINETRQPFASLAGVASQRLRDNPVGPPLGGKGEILCPAIADVLWLTQNHSTKPVIECIANHPLRGAS